MNKKLIFIIILCLPAVFALVWMLSVAGDNFTPSNVSSVILTSPDGIETEYVDKDDKEFLIQFRKNIVSIDDQAYNEDVYSLYVLDFHRIQGDAVYNLCLSADVKKCLAFDSNGNWYRIDKEYAKQLLKFCNIDTVYKYNEIPGLIFSAGTRVSTIDPSEGEWSYLLADESYSLSSVEQSGTHETEIYVLSGEGFDFEFGVQPDWYNLTIYENDAVVYDGLIDSVTDFSHSTEGKLRAVINAEWYNSTTNLYYGSAVYDFYFYHDIKATYEISENEANPGEAIYIKLLNAENENFEVSSNLNESANFKVYNLNGYKILIFPIPADTVSGEYRINLKSEKTSLSIPFLIQEKNLDVAKVGFIGGETAEDYNTAAEAFKSEISSAFDYTIDDIYWTNGIITPVEKFDNGVEQYWISSPAFGVKQQVGGANVTERSFGIHYVKSVNSDVLPIRAVADGTIVYSEETSLYGNTVIIEHGLGFKSVYGHIDTLAFKVGDVITTGTVLGNAQSTAFAVSSTEFFFGIAIDGVFLNPYKYIVEPRNSADSNISAPIEFFNN